MGNIFANPAPTDDDPDFKAFQQAFQPIFREYFEPGAYGRLEYALYNFMTTAQLQEGIRRIYKDNTPPLHIAARRMSQAARIFEFKTPRNANRERRLSPENEFLIGSGEEIVLEFGHHFLYYIFMNHLALHVYRRGIRIDVSGIVIPSEEDIHVARVIHTCIMKPALILDDNQPEWFVKQKDVLKTVNLFNLVSWMLIDMLREPESDVDEVDLFEDYHMHRETVLANTMGRRTYLGDGKTYDTDDPLMIDEQKMIINGVRFEDETEFRAKKKAIESMIDDDNTPSSSSSSSSSSKAPARTWFKKTDLKGGVLAKGFLVNIYPGNYIIPVYLVRVKSKLMKDKKVQYKFTFKTPASHVFKLDNQTVSRPWKYFMTPLSKQLGYFKYKEQKQKIKVRVESNTVRELNLGNLHQLLNSTYANYTDSIVVGNTLIKYDEFVKMYVK